MMVRWTYAERARHESLGGFGGEVLGGLDIGPLAGRWWHFECAIWDLTTSCKVVAPIQEFNVALWELELSARRGETSSSSDRCNFQSSKRSKDFQDTQSFTKPQR